MYLWQTVIISNCMQDLQFFFKNMMVFLASVSEMIVLFMMRISFICLGL
jgi:hypothetical protein